MTNPTLTGQDEARWALADRLLTVSDGDLREYARDSLMGIHPDQTELRRWADLMDEAAELLLAPSLDRGAEEIEDRLDRYEEALHDIQRWSEAYPLSVFPEPDLKKARALLEAGGMTLDSISAYCMRHVVEGVGKIARRALPVPAGLNDGGGK